MKFWIKRLTVVFIFSGSLTAISLATGGDIESGVVDARHSVESLNFRTQLPGKKRFDGKWWAAAESDEQLGFFWGFLDCYTDTLNRKIRSAATFPEYQEAVSKFYAAHPDQSDTTVTAVMIRLAQTFKSKVRNLPGGEVWTEPHGFLDGEYWNESTEIEQIGFLEGYIQCYQHFMTKRRVKLKFSRTAEEYQQLLTGYFGDPKVDHTDEKIAYVLHRFAT